MSLGDTKLDSALSEKCVATILFADIVGSTQHVRAVDPDDVQEFLDLCHEHVRGAVAMTGGTEISFTGDGLIAVFGWPTGQEDHADRACACGWLVQHPLTDFSLVGPNGAPVKFRVGIHSGIVGFRQVHTTFSSRDDVIGNAVHHAATLQKKASPGDVLISQHTLRISIGDIASEELLLGEGADLLDGVAHRLTDAPDYPNRNRRQRYAHPFVGRKTELMDLSARFGSSEYPGPTIGLLGEPGVGKSRLAFELSKRLMSDGFESYTVFCSVQQKSTPYGVIREAIRTLLGENEAISEQTLVMLGLPAKQIAEVFSVLEPTKVKREVAATLKRGAVINSVSILLQASLNKRKVLLIIEDGHVIDDESKECLSEFVSKTQEFVGGILITSRPEGREMISAFSSETLSLQPIPPLDMHVLANNLLEGSKIEADLFGTVIDRSDGNPFVLEEMVRSIDRIGAQSDGLLPEPVESLIHARLLNLETDARHCVQALSLLGESSEMELAVVVAGDKSRLSESLHTLVEYGFLHPLERNEFRFKHAIIADACARSVPKKRRADIHRKAILSIKDQYKNLSGRYASLAYHAEEAGAYHEALDYLYEAVREARRAFAPRSLIQLFERAMNCFDSGAEDSDERFVDFVLAAFDSYQHVGDLPKMGEFLPRAIELARKQNRPDRLCLALCHSGMTHWYEAKYAEGISFMDEALAMAKSMNVVPLEFHALSVLANLHHGIGNIEVAIELAKRQCALTGGDLAQKQLGAAGIPGVFARGFTSYYLMEVGGYEEGLTYAEEAVAIASRANEPYSLTIALIALGRNLLMLSRNNHARKVLESAKSLIDKDGYSAADPNATGLLAMACARTGKPQQGVLAVENCIRSGNHLKTGGLLEIVYLKMGHAECLLTLDRIPESLRIVNEALEIARAHNNPCTLVQVLGLRAHIETQNTGGHFREHPDITERDTICRTFGIAAWDLAFEQGQPHVEGTL